jgi:hypothetical protein
MTRIEAACATLLMSAGLTCGRTDARRQRALHATIPGLRPEGSVLEEGLVEPAVREGVITLERAHVILYRAGPQHTELD